MVEWAQELWGLKTYLYHYTRRKAHRREVRYTPLETGIMHRMASSALSVTYGLLTTKLFLEEQLFLFSSISSSSHSLFGLSAGLICDWAGKKFYCFQLESSILGLVGNFMCCVRVAVKYLVNLHLVCTCWPEYAGRLCILKITCCLLSLSTCT